MSKARPNILLLTTDQQRGDYIAIDENAPDCLQTPNLDSLAQQGTRFRRGYSECPSCIPARRSLMTGMAPAAQGMVGMHASDWQPPHTLAGELRKAGYQTHLVGKLHLQPVRARFGFDSMVWSDGPAYPGSQDDYVRWLRDVHGRPEFDAVVAHGHDPNGWDACPTHLPVEQTYSYWCISHAIEFLEYQRDPTCPFFLNVSLFDPHPPLTPPRVYYDRYIHRELPRPAIGDWVDADGEPRKGQRTDAWRVRLDKHSMQICRAAYCATVNFVDDQIGRLLRHMERHYGNLLANTVILFTSDHGEMLGDHHLYRKCWAYEGSARVPFLLKLPESLSGQADVVSDRPVGLQDVMPTLLDAAGVSAPASCTGKSLLPVARGERAEVRDVLHGEHMGQYEYRDGMHYLVSDRYKYVWYSQRQQEHLFDLASDPHELQDLSQDDDVEAMLAPWRARLVDVLRDRPEGFVRNGELVRDAPHQQMIPDYRPDRFYPYL